MAKKVDKKENEDPQFTGIARSVICHHHNNRFTDYKVVTIDIKDNVIQSVKLSDTIASFEIKAKLEIANNQSIDHLIMNWQSGKSFSK